ncbi:MAG: VWA domain-containing protein [Verrucomicrobiales bacterium]
MSDFLGQFHWIRPAWLWLTIPTLLLWITWMRTSDPLRGWRSQMDPDLLKALCTKQHKAGAPAVLLLVGWLIAVVIVAGPTWRLEPSPFAEDAAPLMIVLKADASMEEPANSPTPMERAQLKIADLAEIRQGQPLGLIAYAGSAHLVLPPTKDTNTVAQMAGEITPEIMPIPGDRLDLALLKADKILASQETAGSILIVADSIKSPNQGLHHAWEEGHQPPINVLLIQSPASPPAESSSRAAKAIGAKMIAMTSDPSDVEKVVRDAARPPRVSDQELTEGEQWHEGGWWLVSILVALSAWSFRRSTMKEASA